ncbi:fumarase, class I alpha subunit [Thermoplasmatales archaeon SCGC AB-539-N05]|nr:fumarase, class I alpha subunit [Thermoplasmatales archaeon SCGC AB-539-N05]ENO12293.1 fumarase, class I alpha subunit [Thermoplasmatales archaeon SCGC AB-539-C06]
MQNKGSVEEGIVTLIKKAETELPDDVIDALKHAYEIEEGIAKTQIETILKNVDLAKKSGRPMCQDTGIQTFFVRVGIGSPYTIKLKEWITNAVKKATKDIPIRPNTVDPFTGKNHGDNTGEYIPYITWDFVDGDDVWITVFPKGGGSENMSKLGMLKPGVGIEGVKDFVVEEMIKAGGNPCPPTVVGVGIGGGADLVMKLAKLALLRPVGGHHKDKNIAAIETELIERINKSGIGPMGLGGKTTVLDVHIEKAHRHPASLPVGIVVQCWADRRADMVIHKDGIWEVK